LLNNIPLKAYTLFLSGNQLMDVGLLLFFATVNKTAMNVLNIIETRLEAWLMW
jgi:hypothetical protein